MKSPSTPSLPICGCTRTRVPVAFESRPSRTRIQQAQESINSAARHSTPLRRGFCRRVCVRWRKRRSARSRTRCRLLAADPRGLGQVRSVPLRSQTSPLDRGRRGLRRDGTAAAAHYVGAKLCADQAQKALAEAKDRLNVLTKPHQRDRRRRDRHSVLQAKARSSMGRSRSQGAGSGSIQRSTAGGDADNRNVTGAEHKSATNPSAASCNCCVIAPGKLHKSRVTQEPGIWGRLVHRCGPTAR